MDLSRVLVDEFARRGLPHEVAVLPCGHYSTGIAPFSYLDAYVLTQIFKTESVRLSNGFHYRRRQHLQLAEAERRRERLSVALAVADDQRDQRAGIEVRLSNARDVVCGHRVDLRNELLEVGIRQIEQRELRDRARHLLRGLEVPAGIRASATLGRATARRLSAGRRATQIRESPCSVSRDRFRGRGRVDARLHRKRSDAPAPVEAGPRAVREAPSLRAASD